MSHYVRFAELWPTLLARLLIKLAKEMSFQADKIYLAVILYERTGFPGANCVVLAPKEEAAEKEILL